MDEATAQAELRARLYLLLSVFLAGFSGGMILLLIRLRTAP